MVPWILVIFYFLLFTGLCPIWCPFNYPILIANILNLLLTLLWLMYSKKHHRRFTAMLGKPQLLRWVFWLVKIFCLTIGWTHKIGWKKYNKWKWNKSREQNKCECTQEWFWPVSSEAIFQSWILLLSLSCFLIARFDLYYFLFKKLPDGQLTNGDSATVTNDHTSTNIHHHRSASSIGAWLFNRNAPQTTATEVDDRVISKSMEKAITRTLSTREKRDCAVIGLSITISLKYFF